MRFSPFEGQFHFAKEQKLTQTIGI